MKNQYDPYSSIGHQMSHAQAAQNAGYGQMGSQYNNTQDYFRLTTQTKTTADIKAEIDRLQAEVDKRELYTVLPGPTNDELNKHKSLAEAWSAYHVIRKLIGLK
jgi:hypothetical protein